jgi:sulfite reductase (ferredoxin)
MQTALPIESQAVELEQFREQVDRFGRGELSAAEFRSYRVPAGIYEQRESGRYMLRVRLPGGAVLPDQMRTVAEVARRFGKGRVHLTTRQDVQIHDVVLEDLHPALVALARAGLSTKGGGGNTVRNVTGCSDAGVCALEEFDVSPSVVSVTEFLLPDRLSYQLPRKYKIGFSGCSADCAGAMVNDLGFLAKRRHAEPGFAVYVGGGMGTGSRVGELLEEFLPAADAPLVAEAVKRVFDKHGNRKNRHRARLRFLLEQIGLERFRGLYETELAALREQCPPLPPERTIEPRFPVSRPNGIEPAAGFEMWRQACVLPQKHSDRYLVQLPVVLGEIDASKLQELADVVLEHGEGMVRVTQQQNFVLRWVAEHELPALHARLDMLAMADAAPPIVRDLVACTGASTCRLGICLSHGLTRALRDALAGAQLDLAALGNLRIHTSGCPNACGRHPVGDIGLFGAARRIDGRLVPHYVLQLGGRVGEGRARLARGNVTLPARNIPAAVVDLLRAFVRSPCFPDFSEFVDAEGPRVEAELAARHRPVPDFCQDEAYYVDWGSREPFSLAGRGPGECSAGVFDLIQVDLATAREALREQRLLEATVAAARALLITRGQQAGSPSEAVALFQHYFLDERLIDRSFAPLLDAARQASAPAPGNGFAGDAAMVASLVAAGETLYDTMDPSLRFTPVAAPAAGPVPEPPEPPATPDRVDREADFRGVVCPLNYVKTKMLLDRMSSGQVLSVLLDEQGGRSVPESVQKDGHQVLRVARLADRWQVLIRVQ